MNEWKFEVGDLVFSIQGGNGVVVATRADGLVPKYPIAVDFGGGRLYYTWDGKYRLSDYYPSLYYRRAKIIDGPAPVRKKPEPKLEPFQKVLVRNNKEDIWSADIFSHYMIAYTNPYVCIGNLWINCIPYDGNEHLLGTSGVPE
jgi:hypothetical protein